MNIKELIDAERWEHEANRIQHNASLDRILAAATEFPDTQRIIVTPKQIFSEDKSWFTCMCGTLLNLAAKSNYCPDCGAKLNWEVE